MKSTYMCTSLVLFGTMLCPFAEAETNLSTETFVASVTKNLTPTASPHPTGQADPALGKAQNAPQSLYQPRTHLRLGATVSPEFNFVGGLDFAVPGVRLSRDFAGRIDVEALVVNFKDKPLILGSGSGTSVYVPFTFNQVYVKGLQSGGKIYGGFGIGIVADFNIFVESPGWLTGKLFLGTQFNPRSSAELGVNFIGSDALVTLQFRLGL